MLTTPPCAPPLSLCPAAKQKELQHLFELVYGCPTSSFNNEASRCSGRGPAGNRCQLLLACRGAPPRLAPWGMAWSLAGNGPFPPPAGGHPATSPARNLLTQLTRPPLCLPTSLVQWLRRKLLTGVPGAPWHVLWGRGRACTHQGSHSRCLPPGSTLRCWPPPAAVGLPPNWRPPPELAPDLPACRPEECSRYGRRRRRVTSYALPESDSEEEVGSERDGSPAPRAIRRRTSSASLASARREGSADSAGARPSPAAALAAEAAGWRSDGPACSGAGCGGASAGSPTSGGSTPSAIFAMQARAAAAFASQPAVPAAPGPMVPVQPLPQQPLSTVPMPAAQPARASSAAALPPLSLVPLVPAAPAAQQPAAFSWGAGRPLAMAPTQPTAAPSLAALLSKPGQAAPPAAPAPAPLAEQLLQQPANALESLSQQLHSLFEDWDAGNVSLLSFGTAL